MFQSEELNDHLRTSDSIKVQNRIFSEWNLNDPQNIKRLGNYRYRPTYSSSPYYLIPSTYIDNEIGPIYYYTDATDSDVAIESGLNKLDEPTFFISPQQKMKMLFSLEDCIKQFRPRSGINKLLYFGNIGAAPNRNQYIDDGRSDSARRPRYYMASRDDQFKYWTSFRKEYGIPTPVNGGEEATSESQVIRGLSFYDPITEQNYIEDAAPFVVYQESVPTNKIVVKMQTNVGEESLGSLRYNDDAAVTDPLFGNENKTTPVKWRIEALKNNSWTSLISFDENSLGINGEELIGPDGYIEISYGLLIPKQYENIFNFVGELSSSTLLATSAPQGTSFLIKEDETDIGNIFIFVNGEWESFVPEYTWQLSSQELNRNSKCVTKLNNPDFFVLNDEKVYREFEFIDGIRIVVQTMNKPNCTFDLIEFSPRLFAEITDSVKTFSITKTLSDLGNTSIPVGGLFASNGTLEIFDVDFSFNENNTFNKESGTGSIVYNHLDKIIKFVFYEVIVDASSELDYTLPVKTMYSFGFPQATSPASSLSIELRDFFFFLESSQAPQLLLTDISLSYAIMILLDYIGFDNYVFKRIQGRSEIIIPYFFVEPGQNVAEVLQKLAIASQSAMFFDEYNNFIVMSKEYLLPEEDERQEDSILLGQDTVYDSDGNSYAISEYVYGAEQLPTSYLPGAAIDLIDNEIYLWSDEANAWQSHGSVQKIEKPNIVSFASKEKRVFNAGQINYTTRYLQRSIGSTTAALQIDSYKNYIYKPVLLWEAQGGQNRQTINEVAGQMGGYVLGAVPLNTQLSSELPYTLNGIVYNNIIDVGENVYWMTNYQGYFYANGEIIKYDAIEYIVSGQPAPVWITNNQQYQDYFGKLPFNGKMYPTGRIRIYTELELQEVDGEIRIKDANPVAVHGRGQFGTEVTSHSAGLTEDNSWTNNEYVRGCVQQATAYLFNTNEFIKYPDYLSDNNSGRSVQIGTTYIDSNNLSSQSNRSGIIRNFLTDKYYTENELSYKKTTLPGTVQSSALVFSGPEINAPLNPANFISYIYKDFIDSDGASIPYKHYGTRMRIIGNIESGTNKSQTPLGNFALFTGSSETSSSSATITTTDQEEFLRGGSGGIALNINEQTNTGYYFEIVALSASNISAYNNGNNSNVASFNISQSPAAQSSGTTVTAYTDSEINYAVGQTVTISGLSVPQFNGEFVITSIDSSKKKFTYSLPTSLTATATTGGNVSANIALDTDIANVFFYKTLSSDKSNKIVSYQRSSNILTVNLESANLFVEDDEITIDIPEIKGDYVVASSSGSSITIENSGANITLTEVESDQPNIYLQEGVAIPYKLWSGLTQINVDGGEFYGQGRLMGEQNSTVYDLAAEYINIGSTRRFYLYLNNKQIAVVDDLSPLPERNSTALFVRGSSKCMFENIYALSNNYSQNSIFPIQDGIAQVFGDTEIDATEGLRKYALNGIIQKTYLSGVSSLQEPSYKLYFEEFGTILREAAYFNVLYDRAYPALSAKLMETTNKLKGYTTSGFYAWSYGAEFLIFNSTDFAITLDDTSGNYLRIIGTAFTQSTTYTLTVDDLYKKRSNLLDVSLNKPSTLSSSFNVDKEFNKIKNSRDRYGKNEITIESPYIQSSDAAEEVFGWTIDKISKPRKMIGVSTFGLENIQLGDIVKVKYLSNEGIDVIVDENSRFVVYQIEYSKESSNRSMTMYLAEV